MIPPCRPLGLCWRSSLFAWCCERVRGGNRSRGLAKRPLDQSHSTHRGMLAGGLTAPLEMASSTWSTTGTLASGLPRRFMLPFLTCLAECRPARTHRIASHKYSGSGAHAPARAAAGQRAESCPTRPVRRIATRRRRHVVPASASEPWSEQAGEPLAGAPDCRGHLGVSSVTLIASPAAPLCPRDIGRRTGSSSRALEPRAHLDALDE